MTAPRTLLAVPAAAAVLAVVAIGGLARGEPSDTCLTAPVEGQKLQKAGRLMSARERFALCARDTCPAEIVQDCTRWARQVDDAIPSVVFAARDGQGHDLADARVSIDGAPASDVTTHATPLDPGQHKFVFTRTGSRDVEREVLLRDGEKNRELVVVFAAAPPDIAPVSTATSTAGPERPSAPPPNGDRPVPTAAWILGGIGLVGLVSFAAFGAVGVNQRSADNCDVGCPPSQKDSVDTKLRIADISLGVGVVALGIAAWIYLARPTVAQDPVSKSAAPRPFLDVVAAPSGGLAVLGARF